MDYSEQENTPDPCPVDTGAGMMNTGLLQQAMQQHLRQPSAVDYEPLVVVVVRKLGDLAALLTVQLERQQEQTATLNRIATAVEHAVQLIEHARNEARGAA